MRATKDSGVDWLGEIPAGWDVLPARALFRNPSEPSKPDDIHLTPSQKYGVLPQNEYMAISGSRVVLNLSGSEQMRHVRAGDFISHLRSFQGGLEYSPFEGKVSNAYTVLRPRRSLVAGYFKHLFKSTMYVQGLQTTTDQLRDGQSIRFKQLSLLALPEPPLGEQCKIAYFLDRETARIDALIAKQEQLITTLDERRGAVISRAVTTGINSDTDLRSAETAWFKMIPSHWEVGPLKRFANVTLGKMVTSDTPDGDAVVMPYLRAASVQPKGRIILDDAKQMSFSLRERSRFALKKNDVVVVEGGSIGRSALVEEDLENWGYQNSINRVRAMRHVTGRYLNWCLQAVESSGIYSTMTNVATIAHLTAEKLETVPIAVPPLAEQEEICAYLEKVTQDIDLLIEKCSAASRVLRERRQALVNAAVTGKLEVTDGYS